MNRPAGATSLNCSRFVSLTTAPPKRFSYLRRDVQAARCHASSNAADVPEAASSHVVGYAACTREKRRVFSAPRACVAELVSAHSGKNHAQSLQGDCRQKADVPYRGDQNILPPSGTSLSGERSTTSPLSSGTPRTSTSLLKPAILFGGKLTTATTWRPTSASGL